MRSRYSLPSIISGSSALYSIAQHDVAIDLESLFELSDFDIFVDGMRLFDRAGPKDDAGNSGRAEFASIRAVGHTARFAGFGKPRAGFLRDLNEARFQGRADRQIFGWRADRFHTDRRVFLHNVAQKRVHFRKGGGRTFARHQPPVDRNDAVRRYGADVGTAL